MKENAPGGHSARRLRDVVLMTLRDRLLQGRYSPGSRISIEEIRAELGVSKQPVMDAMRRLEAVGLVEVVPQSGCRVATYSPQEVRDFYRVFARFEGEVAAAAAARRTAEQLADLDRVWRQIDELETSTPDTAPAQRSHGYRELNREFHAVIQRMADSRIMVDLSGHMWDLSDFLIVTLGGMHAMSESLHLRNDEHDLIRLAIRSGSPEVARVAMHTHIEDTVTLLDAEGP